MKLKKVTTISVALTLLTLSAVGLGLANFKSGNIKIAKAQEVATTDYEAFDSRAGSNGSITADADTNSITYTGGWDSNFAVTDQFNTRAGNYSLKTHVYNADWAISGSDSGTGFAIYYNDNNFITFYLKWNSGTTAQSIVEGVWLNHVNGGWVDVYQSAELPNGAFTTRGNFTDVWSDGMWTTTLGGSSINLRNDSTILINKGFDMTMHVERSTYLERTVDIIYVQIDAFAADGTTPLTAYTPRYAIDAFTNPFGNGVSSLINRKPQIGFMNFNMTDIVYSDIVFTDKTSTTVDLGINRVGFAPTTYTIDSTSNSIKYNNPKYGTGFLLAEKDIASTEAFDLQATVAGTAGNTADTQLGFVYYIDNQNYIMLYLWWDGSLSTFANVSVLATVNGQTKNVTAMTRDPWGVLNSEGWSTVGEIYSGWTDSAGWITDSQEPMGGYSNFNNVRSESAITISSGFSFGIQKTRGTYADRLADIFQVRVTGKDTDNVIRTWYSPTMCFDAYTYPNGATEASASIDKSARMGFYGFQTNEVALSDVRVNGVKAILKAGSLENARTEATTFMNTYMHLSDYDTNLDNTAGAGACSGENGYYKAAKEAWNNLSATAKEVFMYETEYANGYARLLAWASANGDTLNSSNELTTSGSNINSIISNSNNTVTIAVIIAAVAVVSFALVGSVIYLRKRKVSK